ncbi:unnamed protein product [Alopecurus aequalis]
MKVRGIMAGGDHRRGKEPAAAAPAEDKFPDGMRVLAVDDDPVCRRILEALLCRCKYNPIVVSDAQTALEMLREGGEEQFDLVITDVHMPDMDGFKLLELIGLEMDLPVIMLSANGEKESVLKGITHGACDYLVKPVHIKELKNIWQHVIRKNPGVLNHFSSDSDDDKRVVQPVIVEDEEDDAKSKKCSKNKKKYDGDHSDENKESMSVPTTRKKPRVSWTGPLHRRFLQVVNHLGVDKAVPKKILELMNDKNLTRATVGSHLQKFRLYMKRVADDPRKSNHWGSFCHHHEDKRGWSSAAVDFQVSDSLYTAPSMLGPHGPSIQPSNWPMGTFGNGGSMLGHDLPWLPATRSHDASAPHLNSLINISSDHTMMDAFPPTHYSKAYTSVLCENLLEPSNVVPSYYPGNSVLAEMPNGELFEPVNQLPVQHPGFVSQFSSLMNAAPSAVGAHHDAQFPYLVGSSSHPWQNVASSSFPVHMDGISLSQSQVNIPTINQVPSFGASPGQMPLFQSEQQNQMAGIINNNTTTVGAFSEHMTPLFNMTSNMDQVGMSSGNFSPMTEMVNVGSTSSPLPNLRTGSSVAPPTQIINGGSISPALPDFHDSSVAPPTQMLNPGDASGILPVQEGPAGEQALHDQQPNYNNLFFLEDIFTDMLNQDFNDDAFFDGGC